MRRVAAGWRGSFSIVRFCVSLFFTCPLAIKLPFPFKEQTRGEQAAEEQFLHFPIYTRGTRTPIRARERVRASEREDKRKRSTRAS